jgi:hypothetical protein
MHDPANGLRRIHEPVEKSLVLVCGLQFGPKTAISWPSESVYAPISVPGSRFSTASHLPRTAVNKGAVQEVEFHSCLSLVHGARG